MLDFEFLTKYMKDRSDANTPDFFKSIRRSYLLKALLLLPFLLLPNKLSEKKKIFVVGPNVFRQFSPQERSELCLMGGPIEFFLACKYKAGFINTSSVYLLLALNLFTFLKPKILLESKLNKILKLAVKINHGSGVIIHHSDALPYGRLINNFFKKNDFLTVCFQHGYFDGSVIEIDGTYSDFNIAIDNNQLTILEKTIGQRSKFNIMKNISVSGIIYCNKRKKPHCILLGEGWKSHNIEVHNTYIDYIKKLRHKITNSKLSLKYRPHPSEKLDLALLLKMYPVSLTARGEGINCQDIYIGASSSFLAEAAKIGATCISIQGLVPTSTIDGSDIQRYEKDYFIENCNQLIKGSLSSCKGHVREHVSTGKLLTYIDKYEL